jgi:hypothetical protein
MVNRVDRYKHKIDEVVLILADGTLLDTAPVQRLLDQKRAVPPAWLAALRKTEEKNEA